jgi:hypothetical protein
MTHAKLFIAAALALTAATARAEMPAGCPASKQKILILDLKSGWWGGDGGDFHARLYQQLEARCPGLVTFEFHHTPYGGLQPALLTPVERALGVLSPSGRRQKPFASINAVPDDPTRPIDWASFQQIWLLSGGEADTADMRIETEEFRSLLYGVPEASANLFIGTGFGNVYHANPMLAALGLDVKIATERVTDIYPTPTQVTTASWLVKGQGLADHPLFAGLDKLPDAMHVGAYDVASDWLAEPLPEVLQVLARNADGKPVIALGESPTRKLLIDTGLQRSYALVGDYPQTFEYLLAALVLLQR